MADQVPVLTFDQVRNYLKRDTLDQADVEDLIEMVVQEAEDVVMRTLRLDTYTETGIPLQPDRFYVDLEHSPVGAISEVKLDGTVLDPGSYVATRSGIRFSRTWPRITMAYPTVPTVVYLDVTYTAGLGAKPGMRLVLLDRIARILNKQADDAMGTTRVQIAGRAGYLAEYIADGFTPEEEKRLVNACGRKIVVSHALNGSYPEVASPWQSYPSTGYTL